ncbi:hypothetical protein VPGG_00003 [Vibrio phage VBM1]|uniref:hypothetical protein n=1 Tax=Vibrio phage VBM1 TaxID=754074 RepID=UPI0002C0B92B|nr:hypothetical protein VPGG_00003 [Vibrio phage VBM1]AGH07320.1 hypothetical protein VPGG_00003 [Vibrio phage VBM1]
MENKLVPMILFFLSHGEKPRYEVTQKIRNYPKDMRQEAIDYIMKEKLVSLREVRSEHGRGRTPVFISLTEKGIERSLEISEKPRHTSVWNI